MTGAIPPFVAPAYLLLCLLLGGSAQGIWANLLLQLIAVVIIAAAFLRPADEPASAPLRTLAWLIGLAVLWIGLQLVPLPPALWTALPGRAFVEHGYRTLGHTLPWLPVSLAPAATVAMLPSLLPALAMLAAVTRLRPFQPMLAVAALLAGVMLGVLLGAMQVTAPDPANSRWYLYPIANWGVATGFFANSNHMAALLVATIPFLAATLAVGGTAGRKQRHYAMIALCAAGLMVVVIGIFLNGSLAGVGLALPVLAASGLIVVKWRPRLGQLTLAGAVLAATAAAFLYLTSATTSLANAGAGVSVEARREMVGKTLGAARDFAPLGSGLGTFRAIYDRYEDPATASTFHVNHAHSDYAELALELGLPGLVLILLFLAWWARTAWKQWSDPLDDPFGKAAAIASAALLLHSLVDYPLRTAAVSALFGLCLGVMARSKTVVAPRGSSDLRATRHLELS